MNGNEIQPNKREGMLKGGPFLLMGMSIIILAMVSVYYFTFLKTQLFEERKSHIVEFTDKASEIVDSVIGYSWQQVYAVEHVLRKEEPASEEDLLEVLMSTSDFIDLNNSLVLAIDKNANYYSSDQTIGRWPKTELLTAKADSMQLVVTEIPHKTGHSYFAFLERLDVPISMGTGSETITYLCLAVDMEVMRDRISINGFGNQCYTYLVNRDGRRLYKYTYTNNFIEGYNVLSAFREYNIVNGGTYEDFIQAMERGENTALEFEFVDAAGRTQNWFAANAAIASDTWQVLLFVPTEVLGEYTTMLLNRTVGFFVIVSVVILTLTAIAIVLTMVARADKRLVRQKDEANRLLVTAAQEANSANQAKSDFLSHMSHDIRTPINGIMGMTEIALKNIGNTEKIIDCLNKINGSSQHLLGLVNDVLDMSRIESGKTKVNHESFDIRTCVDNCASIIGGQLATRDIELIKEEDCFEHPLVIGDELHLRQIFINILGNSVKFTPDGGKIFFRAKEVEHTEERVLLRFELEDTGIGMKPEFLPHLFEAFAQEDNGTRTTYKGTGLGMAITKKFVELMGGTLEVESQLNVGTKFSLEFWMDIDKNANMNETKAETHVDLVGMKALLVEDIELNLEIAQGILEAEGVTVTSVMNGKEAVDAFADNPPGTFDVVIMDIMMPVMDGITATKTIRAMKRPDAVEIPIIAMTANAFEEDIRNTKEAGMNAHLSKPIDIDMLLNTLSRFYPGAKTNEKVVELKGLKVLLADDVDLNLEIAQEILEEWGAVVTAVTNGEEAVYAFRDNPVGTFDVILMDVHMPVMDGLAATKTIRGMEREDAQRIPIFAMTADIYEEDMQATKEAGMNGHLTKPLSVEKLMWMLLGYRETPEMKG